MAKQVYQNQTTIPEQKHNNMEEEKKVHCILPLFLRSCWMFFRLCLESHVLLSSHIYENFVYISFDLSFFFVESFSYYFHVAIYVRSFSTLQSTFFIVCGRCFCCAIFKGFSVFRVFFFLLVHVLKIWVLPPPLPAVGCFLVFVLDYFLGVIFLLRVFSLFLFILGLSQKLWFIIQAISLIIASDC